MTVIIDGGAGVTFPDTVQQTNGMTNTGGTPKYYAARAWVVFDGSTTPPSILSSVNVASVSRVSTGIFTITLSTPMPNLNYAIAASTTVSSGQSFCGLYASPAFTTTSFTIRCTSISATSGSASTSDYNSLRVSVAVFA